MNETLLNDGSDLPTIDPNKDYYEELTGPGGKFDRTRYKDETELKQAISKSKTEADQYIEILKRQRDEMRTDYLRMREENTSRARLEDLINQLSSKTSNSEETHANEKSQPEFDPKQIESLVTNKVQELEASRQQTANFNMVRDRLRQKYGENYKSVVEKQIEELGITTDDLDRLARNQPKLLIKTLSLDSNQERNADSRFQSPPQSQQRLTDSFSPKVQKRTWSYYKDLMKKDPSLKFDRNTAIQMQKDAIELGDEFRDGDYWQKGLHEPTN